MARSIISIREKSAAQETLSGGKGASLARLARMGFNVPEAFIITTHALAEILNFSRQKSRQIAANDKDVLVGLQKDDFIDFQIPENIRKNFFKAFQKLEAPVAIRSSMVGEDSVSASFAGQLDTFLNVKTEQELVAAIVGCYKSLFNKRLTGYLSQQRETRAVAELHGPAMAIVMQRMVNAEAAGVAFTADPFTGRRNVIIEAAAGLGDGVAGGKIVPDRYVVNTRGVISESYSSERNGPVLPEEQVLRLSQLARAISFRAKLPQDIEWAWDGAEFHFLQSRPITSLAGKRIYSRKLVAEMSPGLIKPLYWTTNVRAMTRNVFGRMFAKIIGPNQLDFSEMTEHIHSRVYANITFVGELLERIGLPSNFFEMMTRDEGAVRRRPEINIRLIHTFFRLVRFVWFYSGIKNDIKEFLGKHNQFLESYRNSNWTEKTPQELMEAVLRLSKEHGKTQWWMWIGAMNMNIRNKLLKKVVRKFAAEVQPGDLIKGLIGLKALEPNQKLALLGSMVRKADRKILNTIRQDNIENIHRKLAGSEEGRMLLKKVDSFLKQFGFLSISGTDFTVSPWIENPELVWKAIGRLAAAPEKVKYENAGKVRREAHFKVNQNMNWALRPLFNRLLKSTILYLQFREKTSFQMSEDAYQARRIFLELGNYLRNEGIINETEDIFYLSFAELQELIENPEPSASIQNLVKSRKEQMELDSDIEPEDIICENMIANLAAVYAGDQDYLVGITGSAGIIQGYARVILDPADVKTELTRNDILVVPFTDVGWTPLFPGIGGIVAESGGQLSHSAIIAREYGLPAVVSVKKATRLIKDGQPITLDGNNGRVYLKHILEN
ncbi:MAG: PEP/pyruvate-binding domain-containing protein [Calditrichia bacterium]